MYATIAAFLVIILGAGIWAVIVGITPSDTTTQPARSTSLTRSQQRQLLTLTAGLAVGVLVWLLSGYLISVLAAPALFFIAPQLIPRSDGKKKIQKLTAMEEWARSLAGVLGAGAGIEQAIIASKGSTPAAIKDEVSMLAARLQAGVPIERALEIFGDDLDDVTGDLLTGSLIIGSRRRGSGLARLLEGTAETIADDVQSRRQIEADRAKPRANARTISIIAITVIAGQFLFNPQYVEPFKTPIGQIILGALTTLFIFGLWWMNAVTREKKEARLLRSAGGEA